jgi:S-DNA-T family DNA segregation ATPase FtsK/SpoIIIE
MIADGLMGAFGLGSHLLSGGLLIVGALCFTRRPPAPSLLQLVGALVSLVSAAIICHLAFKGSGALTYAAGGLLGALCGDGLARLFSAPGTAVIAGTLLATGVVICTDLSLSNLLQAIGGVFRILAEACAEHWEVHRQKAALKREQEATARLALIEAQEDLEAIHRDTRREMRKQAARLKAELEVEREAQHCAALAEKLVDSPHEPPWVPPESAGAPTPRQPQRPAENTLLLSPLHMPVEPAVVIPVFAADPAAPIAIPIDDTPPTTATVEPRIVEVVPRQKKDLDRINDTRDERPKPYGQKFELPPLNLLDYEEGEAVVLDKEALNENARVLVKTFKDFDIEGHVREIRPGPVVTTYEFTPAAGIRVGKIAGMADDLAMALEAMSVRIVAPIPGKNAVGIEIPNGKRQDVYLKELIAHPDFQRARSKLTLALGKDIEGKPFHADLTRMPHVLIAGTTGSGKSVSVNGMILSVLYKATPDEVRMLMIDPKMLELKLYDGIPHLLLPPVTDPKKAALALRWAVEEMERRYQLLADFGVRDIGTFNKRVTKLKEAAEKKRLAVESVTPVPAPHPSVLSMEEAGATVEEEPADTWESDEKAITRNGGTIPDKLPFIVVIVDEFADLIMVAPKDVETYVARLAQKARACGIHVMLATQRPSVDVITGVIKANFPTRMSFKVASAHDSKTIINCVGANRLLGNGDMLMIPPGSSDLQRIHGGFVSETEIARVVNFWKAQGKPQYNEAILRAPDDEGAAKGTSSDEPYDEFFDQAVDIVARTRKVSISEIQRKLTVGYNRAAKMVERMERDGLIGPSQGANKPREVYVRPPDG